METNKYSENQLLELFSSGGSAAEKAFGILLDRYSEPVYWQIRRLTRNHELTNDILQNVWIKVWKNIDSFNGDASLFTWIYRIARNESINTLKSEKRHNSIELDPLIVERLPGQSTLEKHSPEQIVDLLQNAIDGLPDKQALVFQLKYFDELKYSEIAELTGTTEGALKASYSIAVEKIQQFLKAN
jgi:RNA polymerase sigma-70 factor (ECF subfamily)